MLFPYMLITRVLEFASLLVGITEVLVKLQFKGFKVL